MAIVKKRSQFFNSKIPT